MALNPKCPPKHEASNVGDIARQLAPHVPGNVNDVLDALESVLSCFSRRGHAEIKVFVNPNKPYESRVYPVEAEANVKIRSARELLKRWGR